MVVMPGILIIVVLAAAAVGAFAAGYYLGRKKGYDDEMSRPKKNEGERE